MKLLIVYGGPSIESKYSKNAYIYLKELLSQEFSIISGIDLNNIIECPDNIRILKKYDVILSVVYGNPGQEGIIQGICDLYNKKYIGSDLFSCSIIKDKYRMNQLVSLLNIKTPKSILIKDRMNIENDISNTLSFPVVVKPRKDGGLSLGIYYCENIEELLISLDKASKYDNEILVEEYIKGEEFISCVITNDHHPVSLPVIHVEKNTKILGYDEKITNKKKLEINSDHFSEELYKQIQDYSINIFKELNMLDWGYFEFIVHKNDIYFIEGGAVPGLTENSNIPILFRYLNKDLGKYIYTLANKEEGKI